MKQSKLCKCLAAALLSSPVLTPQLTAQSADALIDKLVDKGILSVKEANDLREQSDKNFNQAYAVKSGMPDWVSAIKFYGDFRGRYESFFTDAQYTVPQTPGSENTDFITRDRFRYRLRFGITATLFDNFEAGLRLTSSDAANGVNGGDPISGNTTFQDNATKKFVYIDLAYGRWYFLNGPALAGNVAIGKIENPFLTSDMIFDQDYTPEGIGVQGSYLINDQHTAKLNLGGFMLDELSRSSDDPYLLGAQGRWDASWTKRLTTTAGAGVYSILNMDKLTTASVPNQNSGNTRFTNGVPVYDFNPVAVDASVTYTLDSFPLYKGAFPIKLGGEYMKNVAAPSSADNYGYNVGVMFGKSGKRGTWDVTYTYKWLGANAQWEELVDSDFGAFYASTTTFPGAGASAGYSAGTNIKGHIVRLTYSPYDFLVISGKWFITDLINPFPNGSDSHMNRVQIDATLKF